MIIIVWKCCNLVGQIRLQICVWHVTEIWCGVIVIWFHAVPNSLGVINTQFMHFIWYVSCVISLLNILKFVKCIFILSLNIFNTNIWTLCCSSDAWLCIVYSGCGQIDISFGFTIYQLFYGPCSTIQSHVSILQHNNPYVF